MFGTHNAGVVVLMLTRQVHAVTTTIRFSRCRSLAQNVLHKTEIAHVLSKCAASLDCNILDFCPLLTFRKPF